MTGHNPATEILTDLEFKEGDIYLWAFKKSENYLDYWCKSQIGVVRKGLLVDTYWNRLAFTKEKAEEKLNLEYLGNFSELTQSEEYLSDYYDSKDIVNLNHPNSTKGNFYIRNGAKRCPEKMKDVLQYKAETAERASKSEAEKAERLRKNIALIEQGGNLDDIDIW